MPELKQAVSMDVAIFARASSARQDYRRQVDDLKELCKKQSWNVVEVIAEKVSGTAKYSQRPGLRKLIALGEEGAIKKVAVSEVSRLGRRPGETVRVINKLTELGVSVYIQNHNIETLKPNGRRNPAASVIIAVLSEIAAAENEERRERIMSGQAKARREGRHIGRPPGTSMGGKDILLKYPKVVRCLKEKQSLRNTASICNVSVNTVWKVKQAWNQTAL